MNRWNLLVDTRSFTISRGTPSRHKGRKHEHCRGGHYRAPYNTTLSL